MRSHPTHMKLHPMHMKLHPTHPTHMKLHHIALTHVLGCVVPEGWVLGVETGKRKVKASRSIAQNPADHISSVSRFLLG
eukprot:1154910-Pelagomonas_calceolata.AAC.3